MSKTKLQEILNCAARLSDITRELGGHCSQYFEKLQNKTFRHYQQSGLFDANIQTSNSDQSISVGCRDGVCEVTWKPISRAA
jgi:hypothetical protein